MKCCAVCLKFIEFTASLISWAIMVDEIHNGNQVGPQEYFLLIMGVISTIWTIFVVMVSLCTRNDSMLDYARDYVLITLRTATIFILGVLDVAAGSWAAHSNQTPGVKYTVSASFGIVAGIVFMAEGVFRCCFYWIWVKAAEVEF